MTDWRAELGICNGIVDIAEVLSQDLIALSLWLEIVWEFRNQQ